MFIYCFYGEKIMRKSMAIADEIYQIDWVHLTIKTQKSLYQIIIRARRPIKLTGLSLFTMKIETFGKIVKSAYSAYNLLKST
ncbi:odorant receptor 4-like [Belonocnema kinseyi]|uniref:odorant receptor 4-like n=1 Tax=Belonocnema kinseyi TaxID=2817044 RepID=UPI00143D7159|nr:odorant receptor 4-like [Belonocnema kinseyi]